MNEKFFSYILPPQPAFQADLHLSKGAVPMGVDKNCMLKSRPVHSLSTYASYLQPSAKALEKS